MNIETSKAVIGAHGLGQDRADVVALDGGVAIVVADGVGGRPGGAEAADVVVREFTHRFRSGVPMPKKRSDFVLCQVLSEIDVAIHADKAAGETTAVLALVTGESIAGAFVGDSEAWLVSPDGFRRLTERPSKPYLGYGVARPRPFSAMLGNDTLLIASDGLFKYADTTAILKYVRNRELPLNTIATLLIDAARLPNRSLQDDIGVVLCRQCHGRR